ncbi:hypothetical protein LIER_40165 [Lithospermum erythrorhizon]|uniref:Aminotransferase-like plant mobile domain-containing protein n=1 Tax=Lithospermum erythrorhizon TaxID=34254 RepID=A0AAV3QTL0_LITER
MSAMATFESIPGTDFSSLRMVGPEEDKFTTLVAHTSLYKGCVAKWLPLSSSESEKGRSWSFVQEKVIYLEGPDVDSSTPPPGFRLLGSMISAGHIKWNCHLKIDVKASLCVYDCSDGFLKIFYENWCPSTNTLVVPQGELSISLCDLWELGGLPVPGRLFDEVVPSTECLSLPLDSDNRIPRSCRFLLLGYHRLASHSLDGTVFVSSWIGFWNYSFRTYVGHEAADHSSTKTAPGPVCPREPTTSHYRAWESRDKYPFDVLEVDAGLEEEVYCAAFLSCWLCTFVFPAEPLGLIRASVFKMAGVMAKGSVVSLAPPVLACIYRGLSQISVSDTPSASQACFPAHYLFGWIGAYLHALNVANNRPDGPQMVRYHGKGRGKAYSLSDARTVLHSCLVSWKATHPSRPEPYFFDDRASNTAPNRAFFASIRTGRVCHRVGSQFMVEPYNPYRFSRKLGYTPVLPGLTNNSREMVDLSTGFKFWRLCVLSRAKQSATFLGDSTLNSHPAGYGLWLNRLFSSDVALCLPKKHGKGKGPSLGIHSYRG